jgi:hypothetical protein
MLSYLPWLTSGSTANGTPGSGSTDSVGSTVRPPTVRSLECMNAKQELRNKLIASINHRIN